LASQQIFTDATGKRWGWLLRLFSVGAFVVTVAATGFVISLLVIPFLPAVRTGRDAHPLAGVALPKLGHKEQLSRYLARKARLKLWRAIAVDRAKPRRAAPQAGTPASPAQRRIVGAFYTSWQKTGLDSLRANADKLTHLMPEWLHLDPSGEGLSFSDWDPDSVPHNKSVVAIAREHSVEIHPILNNATSGSFDRTRVHRLLSSPRAQQALAVRVRDWLKGQGFQGLNLDLENLAPADEARLPAFLQRLRAALGPVGLALSVDLEVGHTRQDPRALAAAADFVVLMAYDEHDATGEPGPIASASWYYAALQDALKRIPAEKLVVGLGSYAYDWAEGEQRAEVLDHLEALLLAREAREDEPIANIMEFDPDALNPTFRYIDEDEKPHTVWILDAVTAYNQALIAERLGVRGTALWVIGAEDPGLWRFMRRGGLGTPPPPPSILERVPHAPNVVFRGEGEVLSVEGTPRDGSRKIAVDTETGLCTGERWEAIPTPYVIHRSGHLARAVALTFDDGPSPDWTAKILDALKARGVRATFFLVGSNAERFPELVEREWAEGHEIGNHTFSHPNLGATTAARTRLELNASQRALQSILGRSTLLFRPPYNADAEPVSAEEVAPVLAASALGYLTIGELVDPQDWNLWKQGTGGARVGRTTQDIVEGVVDGLRTAKGNVVLLHDGGGDRSRTLEALDALIPRLRAEGYRFVTTSELLRKTRDEVMPELRAEDQLLAGVDRAVFEAFYRFEAFIAVAFALGIALGVARMLLLIPLALVHRSRWLRRPELAVDPTSGPLVSVLIAAYNERKVIARTLETVLANTYARLEVIVVDDGSTDATAEEVERIFGGDPRVRLVRQDNTGKSGALNHAMRIATGEIQVCFDADTQVRPDCIARLVPHFADARVAAVAGNIKVGNTLNALTRLQSIEYITSQNLDREAYSLLNAVTVVPGAVGAWRRSAVLEVGGYLSDTLAEDMDLTWRLRRAGYVVGTEHRAVGLTEAPDTIRGFFKQRFRWTHGTLQCLWKHRRGLLHHGWFGWLALPTLWLFGIAFQILAPLVDLQMLYLLVDFARSFVARGLYQADWQPLGAAFLALKQSAFFYALFFAVELLGSLIAFRLDSERPRGLWRTIFWQRLIYRQIMYAVLWKSVATALKGIRQGWGKLDRKGTVGQS
jgi:peptidoglycan-N-acetylglucosamine deacetylase